MEIEIYTTPDGRKPVSEFIQSLPPKFGGKTLRAIDLLEEFGPTLREPVSKHISDGIFELRATLGSDTSRVLYFFIHKGKVVLTHGFVKKSRKIPPRELAKAREYRRDYLERCENQGK